jgi:DNA-binding transcriptional MerR regulator
MCALSIGELSARTQTPVATIRHYESLGLLPAPDRTAGNQRRYHAEDVTRLTFIRTRRSLGFSLPAIRDLLARSGPGVPACDGALRSAERQLALLRDQIAALHRIEAELLSQIGECTAGCTPAADPGCALVPGQRILNVRT